MTDPIRVLVWNENRHEGQNPEVAAIYPDGIHGAIGSRVGRPPGSRRYDTNATSG